MGVLSEISRFSALIGSFKGSSLTPEYLQWILNKLGVEIDPIGVNLVVEFIQANVGQRKISTLLENKALMNDLDMLLTNTIDKKVPKDSTETMNARSVIKCPHCELAFSIIDAPGVRDILNKERK